MFQVEFWKLFFKCGNPLVPKKKKKNRLINGDTKKLGC